MSTVGCLETQLAAVRKPECQDLVYSLMLQQHAALKGRADESDSWQCSEGKACESVLKWQHDLIQC
jgi:hypothetical protein